MCSRTFTHSNHVRHPTSFASHTVDITIRHEHHTRILCSTQQFISSRNWIVIIVMPCSACLAHPAAPGRSLPALTVDIGSPKCAVPAAGFRIHSMRLRIQPKRIAPGPLSDADRKARDIILAPAVPCRGFPCSLPRDPSRFPRPRLRFDSSPGLHRLQTRADPCETDRQRNSRRRSGCTD